MAEPHFDRQLNVVLREVHVNHHDVEPLHLPPPVTRRARVVVGDTGVAVDDDQFVRREDIVQAYVQPRPGIVGSVRCLNASGDIVLEAVVDSDEAATALLRALGRDVSHSRASFTTTSPLMTSSYRALIAPIAPMAMIVLVGYFTSLAPALFSYFAMAALFATAALVLASAVTSRIEVGIDGVFVRWFGTERFIGYERIASIQATGTEIRLQLSGSDSVVWRCPRMGMRDALVARVDAARSEFGRRASAADVAVRVERGEREISAWRESLVELGAVREGSYRDPAPRREDLWRLVEDAGAPEASRAGAAVALRTEEGAGARLRIAADAVASPKLRIALEAAADPEAGDEAIDEALGAVAERAR